MKKIAFIYLVISHLLLSSCSIFESVNSVAKLTKETTDSLKVIAKNFDQDTEAFTDSIVKSTQNIENITKSLSDTASGIGESTQNISESTKTMAETAKTIDQFAKSLNTTTVNANQKIDHILSGIDSMVVSSKEALEPLKKINESSGDITKVVQKSLSTADQLLTKVQKFANDDDLSTTIKTVESISNTVDNSLKNLEEITKNAAKDYKNLGENVTAMTDGVKGEILKDLKRLTSQIIKTLNNPTWYGPWLALFLLLTLFYIFSTRNRYKFQKTIEKKADTYIHQAAHTEGMKNLLLLTENMEDNNWINPAKAIVIKSNLLQFFPHILPSLVHLTKEKQNSLLHQFITELFIAQKQELSRYDLKNIHLNKQDFSTAIINKSNFSKAYLNKINLTNASAIKTKFIDTQLQNANLENANLKGAKFKNANLEGANLKGANLAGASLKGANLKNADLTGANIKNAHINKANFEGATLKGVNMAEANARTEESGVSQYEE